MHRAPTYIDTKPNYIAIERKSYKAQYKSISMLGSGSFGMVVLAYNSKKKEAFNIINQGMTNTMLEPLEEAKRNRSPLFAVKILSRQVNAQDDVKNNKEIGFIFNMPSHPNLVQIFDVFVDPDFGRIHIAMEAMNHTLFQLMCARQTLPFSTSTLKSILSQCLNGIKHIHNHGFFHRDIKPENVLVIPTIQYFSSKKEIPLNRKLDNYVVKIADFGLSRSVYNKTTFTSYISTRWYRAPELLLRRRFYSKPVDIWAFGALAVELVNFEPLFPGTSEIDQILRILQIMGTPSLPDITMSTNIDYFIPPGGFWQEASILARNLGIVFPYERGMNIERVLYTSKHTGLEDVIKACLTWNPDTRVDATSLSAMWYFQDTCAYEPYSPVPPLIPSTNSESETSSLLSRLTERFPDPIDPYNYYTDFDDGYQNIFRSYINYQSASDPNLKYQRHDKTAEWKGSAFYDKQQTNSYNENFSDSDLTASMYGEPVHIKH